MRTFSLPVALMLVLILIGLIGDPAVASEGKNGKCEGEPDSALIDGYKNCVKVQYAAHMQGKTGLAIDPKEKVGYLIEDGKPTTCFTVTIGSAGLGSGENQTETGLFTTAQQEGEKYQTSNSDYERKGINIGIGGKILHSDHGNNATAGCVGIQMDKWKEIFDKMAPGNKVDPSPVYLSGGSCDHQSPQRKNQDMPADPGTGTKR